MPFSDEYFDVVVSFETIEHLKNYRRFLDECRRVLKKDGLFICSTPNKQIFSPHTEVSVPVHVHEFYINEFHSLLKEYFIDIRLYGQRFIGLKTRIKNDLFYMASKLLSITPKGDDIKKLIKSLILRSSNDQKIAKLGIEITDKILNEKYKILLYKKSFLIVPGCIIAVGKNNSLLN